MEKEQEMRTEGENIGEVNNNQYIEALNEMRQKTVDKKEYEKLQSENKQLLQSILNGEQLVNQEVKEEEVDLDEIRHDLFQSDLNNLDYWKKTLQLRDELIKRGEKDIFLPTGKNVIIEESDITSANRVADVVQDCIDKCNDNSNLFTALLNDRLVDAPVRK